jgi:hypothetical protein
MALSVKQLLRRRGALVAAVTALSLGLLLLAQDLLPLVVWVLAYAQQQGDGEVSPLVLVLIGAATKQLPFAVGFFFSLWLVRPIVEQLRLLHVITRSVLATGIGVALLFVVGSIVSIARSSTVSGAIFGNSFPRLTVPGGIPPLLGEQLEQGFTAFISFVPVGILAGVLLWLWRKTHPPRFHAEGVVDV